MKFKLEYLLEILEKQQYRHLKDSLPGVSKENFCKSSFYNEAREVYQSLGGITDDIPWRQAEWDLEFENFAINLDEEPSFNRYRAITLKDTIYSDLQFFNLENYKRYCRQFENECLKTARSKVMWTDIESEMLFGVSQEPGDLALKGSSKWKHKAFIEYLEDIQAHYLKIKLIRISIFDNMMINNKLIKLDHLLLSKNAVNEKYLLSYLHRRIPAQ